MSESFPADEFADLIDALWLGELQPAQAARLEQLTAAHPDCCRSYVRSAQINALLERFDALDVQHDEVLRPFLPTAESPGRPPVLGFLGSALHLAGSWLSSPRALALTVAGGLLTYFAVLAISLAITRANQNGRDAAARPDLVAAPPARIISASKCRWQDHAPGSDLGAKLPAGTSRLTEGVVELEFDGGARVSIEGPAEFSARSGQWMKLTHGRLVAYVPERARGFTVATPTAEVIDLGTEFGVEVDSAGKTDVHVLKGVVDVKRPATGDPKASETTVRLRAGEAVRVTADQPPTAIRFEGSRFAAAAQSVANAKPRAADRLPAEVEPLTKIWLGNLFDDRAHTPLATAMRTDTFGAEADFNDLGVSRVICGGPALVEIAPDIKFDFGSVGWEDNGGSVANDSVDASTTGLRLTGDADGMGSAKIEDGIGMHANAALTFSLPEIRAAWKRDGQSLEFICDAAGVNDGVIRNVHGSGSAHLIVIVSSRTKPLAATVDGVPVRLGLRDGHPFVQSTVGKPLTGGGRTFRVSQTLEPAAEYLTLVCTSAGDGIHADHGAWIGARLEVAP